MDWRRNAGPQRNVCRGAVAATRRRRASLPRQEHIGWAAASLAGIADATPASRAHARAAASSGWGPAGRRTKRAKRPTARSGASSEPFKPANQEKGGARGTAEFREETSKKADNRFGSRVAATRKVGSALLTPQGLSRSATSNRCGHICDSRLPAPGVLGDRMVPRGKRQVRALLVAFMAVLSAIGLVWGRD